MEQQLGDITLSGGLMAGQYLVHAFQGGELLFTVTADTEDAAFGQARSRLQADAPTQVLSPDLYAAGGTVLDLMPEISALRADAARKLLDSFLASQNHPQPASTFKIEPGENEEGDVEAYWTAGARQAKGQRTPRLRAYLAFYWLVSRNGKLFNGRGIPLETRRLWPDRGVMRECLLGAEPLVRLTEGCFVLTAGGETIVREVLAAAPWPSLISSIPEVAAVADAWRTARV